jgi:hypothetical protein
MSVSFAIALQKGKLDWIPDEVLLGGVLVSTLGWIYWCATHELAKHPAIKPATVVMLATLCAVFLGRYTMEYVGLPIPTPPPGILDPPREKKPKPPPTRPITPQFAPASKQQPQPPVQFPDDPSIAKVRADATSLIYRLYKSMDDEVRDINNWRSFRQTSGVQIMITKRHKEFSENYNDTYRNEAISIRKALMGHIRHLPPTRHSTEHLYKPLEIQPAGWPSPQVSESDVSEQLCDLRMLLNQLEKENNLELSATELVFLFPCL